MTLSPASSRGGGGLSSVTDGSTSVANATTLDFTSGGTVSDGGGGTADVAIAPGTAVLFDSTLSVAAATIDTGAGGIAGGHPAILVYLTARTTDAGASGIIVITFNGDSSAIYDLQNLSGSGSTASATATVTSPGLGVSVHGAGGTSGYASVISLAIPNYAGTTFNKTAQVVNTRPDATAGNQVVTLLSLGYRSTAAISRLTATSGTANFVAGSRLTVLGL